MAAITICSDFGAQKTKSDTVSTVSPSISHEAMANRWGIVETVADFIFWFPKSLKMVTAAMKLKDTYSWKESYDQPRQHIKKQRYYFANLYVKGKVKVCLVKAMVWLVVMDMRFGV